MRNLFCGAILFACCHVSLAAEPAIPLPPTPVETAPVNPIPVPTRVTPSPASSAAAPVATSNGSVPAGYFPARILPNDPGVWYRPEAVVPPNNDGLHLRYPYYSYRRPWYPPGPASVNVTIIW